MALVLVTKSLLVWLSILAFAIANGALREAVLTPNLGQVPGLILSGALLSMLIVCVAYAALPWLGATKPRQLAAIGGGWLICFASVGNGESPLLSQ